MCQEVLPKAQHYSYLERWKRIDRGDRRRHVGSCFKGVAGFETRTIEFMNTVNTKLVIIQDLNEPLKFHHGPLADPSCTSLVKRRLANHRSRAHR